MILDINDPIVGAYVASVDDLRFINAESWRNQWGARWSSDDRLLAAIDVHGKHVLVPLLKNGGSPESFRCYLWYLISGGNGRRCALVDVSVEVLGLLPRMDKRALEGLVALLFSELDLTATT